MDCDHHSLKNENEPVDIDTLKRWSETEPLYKCIYPIKNAHKSPYQYNSKLNNRIILWQGDITNIKADAIVHASNRTLSDKSFITRKLYEKAGVELWQEVQKIKSCPTGEVRVTQGYNLPVRYIIHTASPYYNVKYSTAAETSLISCYRNVLYKAYELGVRTLAFSVINQVRCNYPPDEGAHAALRTIREFLEVQESLCHIVIHTIILVVESCDASIYEVLLPLYFPRSSQEQRAAVLHLPIETECVHNDRRIRIIDNPQHYTYRNNDTVLDMSDYSFTQMQGDLDRQRLLGDRKPFPSVADQIIAKEIHDKERYDRLLRRAKTEDLSEISGIGCLYQSGYDRYGRPVIVFVGKWFRFKDMNLDKALLYLIYLLDPLVKGDYVVMYFHTMTASQNYPSFSWLREVYNILPYKYKKNLKSFYIVHPTFWTRMMVWWFTTFMAPAIKQKVLSISGVEYLYSIISPKELEIPAFITEYDMTINGIRYFQPSPSSSSSTST